MNSICLAATWVVLVGADVPKRVPDGYVPKRLVVKAGNELSTVEEFLDKQEWLLIRPSEELAEPRMRMYLYWSDPIRDLTLLEGQLKKEGRFRINGRLTDDGTAYEIRLGSGVKPEFVDLLRKRHETLFTRVLDHQKVQTKKVGPTTVLRFPMKDQVRAEGVAAHQGLEGVVHSRSTPYHILELIYEELPAEEDREKIQADVLAWFEKRGVRVSGRTGQVIRTKDGKRSTKPTLTFKHLPSPKEADLELLKKIPGVESVRREAGLANLQVVLKEGADSKQVFHSAKKLGPVETVVEVDDRKRNTGVVIAVPKDEVPELPSKLDPELFVVPKPKE